MRRQTAQIGRIGAVIAKSFFADLQRSKTCYDILTEKSSDSKGTVGDMATFSALDPAYFLQSRGSAVGRKPEFVSVRCFDDLINTWISPMSDGAASFPPLRLYTPRPRSRSDWNEIRARIDLTKLAAASGDHPWSGGACNAAPWAGIARSTRDQVLLSG